MTSRLSASRTRSRTVSVCQGPGNNNSAPSRAAASHRVACTSSGTALSANGWRLVCRCWIPGCSRTRSSSRRRPTGSNRRTAASSVGSCGSGKNAVSATRSACAAATRRLNSAAPQPMCNARLPGSERGMARSRSAYNSMRRSPVTKRNRHGCALCMDGAAVASATSFVTVFSSSRDAMASSSHARDTRVPPVGRDGWGAAHAGFVEAVCVPAPLGRRPAGAGTRGPVQVCPTSIHHVRTQDARPGRPWPPHVPLGPACQERSSRATMLVSSATAGPRRTR